jgi:hypothetical protein
MAMNWLLLTAALACNPGDRLVDLHDKIPRGMNSIYLVVTVDPFYARFYIYQPGFPDSVQHCCGNRPTPSSRCQWSTVVTASGKAIRR